MKGFVEIALNLAWSSLCYSVASSYLSAKVKKAPKLTVATKDPIWKFFCTGVGLHECAITKRTKESTKLVNII